MKPCSGPLVGEPPTGEPDAGDPPVRFGGRGAANQCSVPTPIGFFMAFLDSRLRRDFNDTIYFTLKQNFISYLKRKSSLKS